jgi:hypothetical protein
MRAIALLSLLCAGCPEDVPLCSGFVGDRTLPVEVELVTRDEGIPRLIAEGDEVPLIQPPQGGKVVFASVRARNLDTCALRVNASLRDTCTNRILALEGRPINLRRADDGWAYPADPTDLNNYANVAACPSEAARRDIEGEPYRLRISVLDSGGRTAEAMRMVVPVCGAEPELAQTCTCECGAGYETGEVCQPEPDGGPPPGVCGADAGLPDAGP